MYKEVKHRKISSKEISNPSNSIIKKKIKKNELTKKKESQKLLTNHSKVNTESRTTKKESNSKINHLNLKNIIKKIDLFAISLSKKSKTNNLLKNKIKNIKNSNKPFTNFIKIKNSNNKENKTREKRSSIKENLSTKKKSLDNFINFESITASENRVNKIDFIKRYKQQLIKDKSGREMNHINNTNILFNIINHNHSNIKINDSSNNSKKVREKDISRHFRRNFTELGMIGIDSKNSIRNKELQISFENNYRRKNASTKNKNVINNYYYSTNNNSTIKYQEKNKRKKLIINEELKNYILKGNSSLKNKSEIKKKKLYLTNQNNKIKTKQISRENFKKSIPKPINTFSDLNKIRRKSSQTNTNKNKIEILNTIEKEKFALETFNTNLKEDKNEGIRESDYLANNDNININRNIYNDFNNTFHYFINNALINIRGISIAGKDSKNQMKINQDSYIIKRDINNIKNFNLFGVFDGHGYYGKTISNYLKENIIKKIEETSRKINSRNLENIYKEFKKDNYQLIKNVFYEIDTQILNNNKEFDVTLSGSTCNLIIQIADHIICANTGDSRAILIYNDTNKPFDKEDIFSNYKVYPLSYDCKPNLPIERGRILKKQGIIRRLKDFNQKEIGPLRVFSKGSFLPGLSMSRSFGDKIGKDIGIIVDPIINEYNLNSDVKYIVMASDGLWEFMTNEKIMEIGNRYYVMNDPDNFCQILLKNSKELWERKSRNIDDITIIVIFFTFL